MNCFQHAPSPAVGLCKNCQRGVCPECLADLGDGLACRGRCEQKVQSLNALLHRSPGTSSTAWRLTGGMFLLVSLLSLIAGAGSAGKQGWLNGSTLAGLAFAFFGVMFYRLGRRYHVTSANGGAR